MLDKMVNMRYTIPDNVDTSPEGRDLLRRMLLPDPQQRIQLEQIMQHPWFVTNLPPEAATMNDTYLKASFPPGACVVGGRGGEGAAGGRWQVAR